MKKPKLVLIEWIDAFHLDAWQFEAVPKADFDPCWSVDLTRTSAFTTRDSYLAAGLYAVSAEL